MAQTLQGLSQKVCSTISLKFLVFGSFILALEILPLNTNSLLLCREDI